MCTKNGHLIAATALYSAHSNALVDSLRGLLAVEYPLSSPSTHSPSLSSSPSRLPKQRLAMFMILIVQYPRSSVASFPIVLRSLMQCPVFCQAVLGKTKNKSHLAAALMSSQPIYLSRSFPQGAKKAEYKPNGQAVVHERSDQLGHHQQQSRQIAPLSSQAVHSSSLLRSRAENQRAASTQLRYTPAGSNAKQPTESENAVSTDGSRPLELQRLGLTRSRGGVHEDGQVEEAKKQQQEQTGSGTGASLDTIMAKAKVAADNIRLLLHAKVRFVWSHPTFLKGRIQFYHQALF